MKQATPLSIELEKAATHVLAILRFVGREPIERRRWLGVCGEMMGRGFCQARAVTKFILVAANQHTGILKTLKLGVLAF